MPDIEVSEKVYQKLLKLQAEENYCPISDLIDQLIAEHERRKNRIKQLKAKLENLESLEAELENLELAEIGLAGLTGKQLKALLENYQEYYLKQKEWLRWIEELFERRSANGDT